MRYISRDRLRRAAFRLLPGQRTRAEAVLRSHIKDLDRHVNTLERRLHVAEFTVAQMSDAGLIGVGVNPPETFARWLTWSPPGHFYSPIPNLPELEAAADRLWPEKYPTELAGIDLRPDQQLETFSTIAKLARAMEINEHKTEPWRYYSDNVAYGMGDALILHGMLRHCRPQRLVEVGSGHSSAMILDTVEHYLGGKTEVTFIEPYPELLSSLLRAADHERVTIVPTQIQDVPLEVFTALQSGDVLFIDSTHVLKTGSDVAWLYANILPNLNEGVYVHIHDVFYPFEYRREWVLEGRAWTEAYLVRAFLTLNSDFEIVLFSDWLANLHEARIEAELPAMLANTGAALWLRRVGTSRPIVGP